MLEIRTLGGLEIRLGGRPIDGVLAPKSVALLCYLAVTTHGRAGRPYTRAALAGLLWVEATEANARSYLRQALAELRRRASPHLTITRSTVAFDAASPHWLDVAAFEHRIFPADPKAFTPPDLSALEEAVDMYHGDFMAGFYVRRAPAFEEWVLLERERLRLEALRALHALIGHFSARGQHARAIDYAASLLALEPDAETVALFERIRVGKAAGARDSPLVRPPPAQPAGPLTPLIGRAAELADITSRLQDPACRLLTLTGTGGVGRSPGLCGSAQSAWPRL